RCESLETAAALIEAVVASELTPVVLDLYRSSFIAQSSRLQLVLGFAGTREEVDWQLAKAAELGCRDPAGFEYEAQFWSDRGPLVEPTSGSSASSSAAGELLPDRPEEVLLAAVPRTEGARSASQA